MSIYTVPPRGWREEKIRSVEELRVGDVVARANSSDQWPLVWRAEDKP